MSQQISYQIGSSLYLSINDRCTLECDFCPKTQGVFDVKGYDLKMDHRPTAAEIIANIKNPADYDEVVFCGYGEPTLRLKILLEVSADIRKRHGRVRVNTDGLANLVHKRNVLPELGKVVNALSVSMNAQNITVYNRHCLPQLPGSYDAMLNFLQQAPSYIEQVTATAIHGLDGVDIDACKQLAEKLGVNFRQRELDVVG